MKIRYVTLATVVGTVCVCAVTGPAHAQLSFTEAASTVGVDCTHTPEMNTDSGGIAVADFNRDGAPDIFLLSGNGPDRLYINDGAGNFTDQAAAWGLTEAHYGVGVSAADFNNDGWVDVYVTSLGPAGDKAQVGQHRLYRNDAGQSFTNIADSAGVRYTSYDVAGGKGSAWGDYDLDGDLDLFVADWSADSFATEHNRLYRNNGDETFTDVTLAALGSLSSTWGFQPVFADMNGDRYPELLLAADFETSKYFINNGDGTFTEFTDAAGLGLDDNGMGQTVGDVNNDLLPDWYVTSIHYGFPVPDNNPGNMLYIAQGNDLFTEVSVAAGCNDGGWGWGTVAADLDNDGWLDLVEVNGRAAPNWDNEQAYLFRNLTTTPGAMPTFEEVAIPSGFAHYANQSSMVVLDADSDGDLDIISFANSGPLAFFENTSANDHAWLEVVLDTSTNPQLAPDGFGTRLELTAAGLTQMRIVDGRPTYLATCGTMTHFGLDEATAVQTLHVQWAHGVDSQYSNLPVNQRIVIQAPSPGDLDGDGSVNVFDLLDLLAGWGTCAAPPQLCPGDLNNDQSVNVFDLLTLLANWG